jgi:hypothetical protein
MMAVPYKTGCRKAYVDDQPEMAHLISLEQLQDMYASI